VQAGSEANREASASKGRDRLGRDFAKLWLAQGVSNLGDGVYLTALPLPAATLTRDPLPMSAVMFAGVAAVAAVRAAGRALLDRWERRRVMWMVDAARLVVVGSFAAAVLVGWASMPLLMAAGFLLGTGQTLVDTASQTLILALVSRDRGRLERANGRLAGTGWSPSSSPARRPAGGDRRGAGLAVRASGAAGVGAAGRWVPRRLRRPGRGSGSVGSGAAGAW
jgi:MFS family permease